MANEDILIKVKLQDDGLQKGLQNLEKTVNKFTKATDKLVKKEKEVVALSLIHI